MSTNIKGLREERHLALEYVADKIGVTEIEMKRIEKRWDELMPWNWAQQPANPAAQAA